MEVQTLEVMASTAEDSKMVKCGYCRKEIPKLTAYKSPDEKHDFYYCSEFHYTMITED